MQETARQEKEHANVFSSYLEGETWKNRLFPAGRVGTTAENLLAARKRVSMGTQRLYPAFAAGAKEEGFPAIAALWRAECIAEKHPREALP
jgi:rubrerythrin